MEWCGTDGIALERAFCVASCAESDFVLIRSETGRRKLGRILFALYRPLTDTGLTERDQDQEENGETMRF